MRQADMYPLRLSHLNALDFFVYGLFKERVTQFNTEEKLGKMLEQVSIKTIPQINFEVTGRKVKKRARGCIRQKGGNFEQNSR